MRMLDGFRVDSTAVHIGDEKYRPGLMTFTKGGLEIALFVVGYADTVEMNEKYAHEAARAILDEVIRIGDDGKAVFLADGAIRVRLVRQTS